VADGTYYENINFSGKAITVKSADGPSGCVIDGTQTRAVVQFVSNEQTDSVLDGFQITNGVGELYEDVLWDYYLGGGIFCYWSGPTIKNCWIHGNDPRSQSNFSNGGGIYIGWMGEENEGGRSQINPVIDGCKIYENEVYGRGGGIYCGLLEPPSSHLLDESITITGCEIYDNEDAQIGGGVAIWRAGLGNTIYFDYNTVYGNTINTTIGDTEDAAVDFFQFGMAYVRNNLIYDNEHGGLLLHTPWTTGSTITCNTIGDNNEYAIKYKYADTGTHVAYNNIFWDNGSYEVVIDYTDDQTFTFDYNDIKGGSGGIDDNGTGNTINYYGNNINSDPLYNSTYHIPSNSPCKNDGSNTYIDPPYYDIDGQDRNNGTVDMGADEYW
jgi:hypothetical protein